MKKLSGTDALFLYSETSNTPQHVGSIQHLEVPDELRSSFFQGLRDIYMDRLHMLPYLTSRLKVMPWDIDHPVWVRHVEFDIDEHFHHVTLDGTATVEQLEAVCAELYEPVLDRSKPLWKVWVIDGLANGQVAVLTKTHHACLDGMASVSAVEVLGDYSPTPREVEPAPANFWQTEDLSPQRLMRESWVNLARYNLDNLLKWPARVAAGTRVAQRIAQEALTNPRPMTAPKTIWNSPINAKRSVVGAQFSLATLKAISKKTGTKINDVVLAITSDALTRYLKRQKRSVAGKLIAGCPVSLRKANDSSMDNQVSMMMVSLENDVVDPAERLAAIHQSSTSAKELLAEMGNVVESDFGSPFLPAMAQTTAQATASGAFASFGTQIPISLVVSNVPGVRRQLYSAGARVLGSTPLSIVTHGSGLNVTVTSYLDRFDLGLTAATSVVPDITGLRDDFVAAYEALVEGIIGATLEQPKETELDQRIRSASHPHDDESFERSVTPARQGDRASRPDDERAFEGDLANS